MGALDAAGACLGFFGLMIVWVVCLENSGEFDRAVLVDAESKAARSKLSRDCYESPRGGRGNRQYGFDSRTASVRLEL